MFVSAWENVIITFLADIGQSGFIFNMFNFLLLFNYLHVTNPPPLLLLILHRSLLYPAWALTPHSSSPVPLSWMPSSPCLYFSTPVWAKLCLNALLTPFWFWVFMLGCPHYLDILFHLLRPWHPHQAPPLQLCSSNPSLALTSMLVFSLV